YTTITSGYDFRKAQQAMGIRDRPISPRSPWQNPYIERLIGTVRRECLDCVLIFGEAHLRLFLSSYAVYYNEIRAHLALGKDAPLGRAVQRTGGHCSHPDLVWAAPPLRPDMIFGRHKGQASRQACSRTHFAMKLFFAAPLRGLPSDPIALG